MAVALSLAERLREEPAGNLDVWVVLTGGEECGMEGMRSFLRSHRKELDPASTFVLTLDSVGAGDVRWVTSEGLAVAFPMDRRLLELCTAIAEADGEGEARFRAAPIRRGFASDSLAASARRLRATTITCSRAGRPPPAPAPHPRRQAGGGRPRRRSSAPRRSRWS